MDDKTMLELAAKAAGIKVRIWEGHTGVMCAIDDDRHGRMWMPLTDDGDALRLAVNLSLAVYISAKKVSAHYDAGIFANQPVGVGCQYAATRRAIVRVAAEIGATKAKGEE